MKGSQAHLLGILRDPEGDRTHLQRWVCGIVRAQYLCRMPLCQIAMGLGVFLLGITRDREGDRKHLLGIVRDPGGSYPFAEVGVRNRVGIVPV